MLTNIYKLSVFEHMGVSVDFSTRGEARTAPFVLIQDGGDACPRNRTHCQSNAGEPA